MKQTCCFLASEMKIELLMHKWQQNPACQLLWKTNATEVYAQQPEWEEKPKQIAIKIMCSYPNSTPNPTTGREIQAVNSRKAEVAAVVPELWDWRPIYCLLCPRGRWRCQCSEMLVPQFPLMGGRRVQVLHWIKPPASSSTLMYNLATTVNCATYTVSGADPYCPRLAFCIRQHMWCIYWHRWGCVQQKVWVELCSGAQGAVRGLWGDAAAAANCGCKQVPPHTSLEDSRFPLNTLFLTTASLFLLWFLLVFEGKSKQMKSKQKLKFHTSSEPICFKV